MIDLETLSTRANAHIISVGAVVFSRDEPQPLPENINDLYPGHKFYMECHFDGQDRHIDGVTLEWWMHKGRIQVFPGSNDKSDLVECLNKLRRFILDRKVESAWSKGSMFDLTIITDAFNQFKIPDPLSYKNKFCFRTFINLFQSIGIEVPIPYIKGAIEHNALHDAVTQAFWFQQIWEKKV